MTRVRSVRTATGVVLWLAAAAAATAVGMFAVGAIGNDIFGSDQQPLSQSQVDEQLAGSTRTPAATTPPPSTTASTGPSTPPTTSDPPTPQATPVTSDGGTVLARCAPGGLVDVLSAVPAQGFSVDSDDDELDDHPQIKFESGEREIEVRLRCVGGRIVPEIKPTS
ncbi:MAG: hypothetical protein GEV28_05515 [Actinophytocola sp.]|uniref:hypothetical protein n=1 Tax=Actinophytocola sp. TaxID=1872138 RepID=UPI00132770FE|nr:hypothetical protein [Actinophytocola sp.]MPZ79872.1 hypothetical protein [Actinophytocola sp.]